MSSTPRTASSAPAPAPPEQPSSGPSRSRRLQIAVAAVSAVLLGVAALIFFLQGEGGDDERPAVKKSVSGNVSLVLGGVQNANAGAPAALSDDAASGIMQLVAVYVDRGLVVPVKTGKPPENVAELFDAGTQVAIQGPDKDVLFENGQPALTGDYIPSAQPVIITALSDGNGQFVLATAAFSFTSEVGVKGGTLKTTRNIALTMTPDAGWKITGYDVGVIREGASVGVPTATAQR
jgi:hypothetical protein